MTEKAVEPVAVDPAADPTNTRVEVNNLTQFVNILVAWHSAKVHDLQHLLTIPDEGHISVTIIEDDEAKEVMLDGPRLLGFKAGVSVALTALGTLPFGVTYEEDVPAVETQPADAPGAPENPFPADPAEPTN